MNCIKFQVHVLDSMRKTSQKLKAEAAEDLGSDFIEEFANEVLSSLDGVLRASSKRQAEIRKKQENNETVPSGGTESVSFILWLVIKLLFHLCETFHLGNCAVFLQFLVVKSLQKTYSKPLYSPE